MEAKAKEYWNGAHERYATTEWIDKPTLFAAQAITFFPREGKILDAGCGQGQDSRYFAEKGYQVVGIDFAPEGITRAQEKTPAELNVEFREADLVHPLPFANDEFEVVHSHLAAHYFSTGETRRLFAEFTRVLKTGGVLTLLLNSVHDAEYGEGEKIEEDYFRIDGVKKRYFSSETLRSFVEGYEILMLDEQGETYKDRAVGNSKLVRFIGRKL